MTWKPTFNPEYFYFVTTKAVDYLHLFQRDLIKRVILDIFDCLRLRKRIKLYSFVIMPNHIHFLGQFTGEDPLANVVRDFKRQTSDRILRQLKVEGDTQSLDRLAGKVNRPEKQQYKVWEDDYNAKDIFSTDFLQQKIDYIHSNPCQPHWTLTRTPEEYMWSSARFYHTEEACIIPNDDVREALLP